MSVALMTEHLVIALYTHMQTLLFVSSLASNLHWNKCCVIVLGLLHIAL